MPLRGNMIKHIITPTDSVIAPAGSTHYQLVAAGSDVNFEAETYTSDRTESGILPIDNVLTQPITLHNTLPAASTNPLFLLFGINFYQEVNGTFYVLKNGSYNALQLVQVSGTP